MRDGWIPPEIVTEEEYQLAKTAEDIVYRGFVGFGCSFGAKFFGGYARSKNSKGEWRNHALEARNNLLKQASNLKGIEFRVGSYLELDIPYNSIIYCDPPYKNTLKYSNAINYDEFWNWCKDRSLEGHSLFVSEYDAPKEWKCIWQKETHVNFDSNRNKPELRIEKLFTYDRNK